MVRTGVRRRRTLLVKRVQSTSRPGGTSEPRLRGEGPRLPGPCQQGWPHGTASVTGTGCLRAPRALPPTSRGPGPGAPFADHVPSQAPRAFPPGAPAGTPSYGGSAGSGGTSRSPRSA